MNELLNKQTLKTFVFILPTFTLVPKLAPFLVTPEDIDYIYKILAEFCESIICFLKASKYGSKTERPLKT